eukprot:TRINITY_DN35297_c0_g1_i1.p1 TRINITY_DN35297_c0_g1~~TRINITY_DN35297_c0_g1_i1.p1  ORF type:complete len:637 (+),score=100.12 TRINITY_DN35297_c0_g1_i1:23-1933(+)
MGHNNTKLTLSRELEEQLTVQEHHLLKHTFLQTRNAAKSFGGWEPTLCEHACVSQSVVTKSIAEILQKHNQVSLDSWGSLYLTYLKDPQTDQLLQLLGSSLTVKAYTTALRSFMTSPVIKAWNEPEATSATEGVFQCLMQLLNLEDETEVLPVPFLRTKLETSLHGGTLFLQGILALVLLGNYPPPNPTTPAQPGGDEPASSPALGFPDAACIVWSAGLHGWMCPAWAPYSVDAIEEKMKREAQQARRERNRRRKNQPDTTNANNSDADNDDDDAGHHNNDHDDNDDGDDGTQHQKDQMGNNNNNEETQKEDQQLAEAGGVLPVPFMSFLRLAMPHTTRKKNRDEQEVVKHCVSGWAVVRDMIGVEGAADGVPSSSPLVRNPNNQWQVLFSTKHHGRGFQSLHYRVYGYSGPTVLLIKTQKETTTKEQQEETTYGPQLLGAFIPAPWNDDHAGQYSGGPDTFLFSMSLAAGEEEEDGHKASSGDVVGWRLYPTTNHKNHYMYYNPKNSHHLKGLGFGGQVNYFRLWVDLDLEKGTCSDFCTTFHKGPLLDGNRKSFTIDTLEVYGCGGVAALKDLLGFHGWLETNVENARKVDTAAMFGEGNWKESPDLAILRMAGVASATQNMGPEEGLDTKKRK